MYKSGLSLSKKANSHAFTIVELLVVIVVIGILAAITIVSYSGIANRAKIASLQSDLANASVQFKIFHVENGYYPATISTDCAVAPSTSTNLCLKPSLGNSYSTVPYSNPTPQTFVLTEVNGSNVYHITESSAVTLGYFTIPSLAVTDPANWSQVGSQTWAKSNINVGTMVSGNVAQTNNATVEKYCYDNIEANCTANGGLYQWDEMMQYIGTAGTRGICPAGSHIPTDTEFQNLELQLGMSPGTAAGQVGATGWRGTDQGTKLKVGGASGLNMPLAGYRTSGGAFSNAASYAYIWTSSDAAGPARVRFLGSGFATVSRDTNNKAEGFSLRCMGDV